MSLYSGIDLHSNNHVLTIIDEKDARVFEKRLPNDLDATLRALRPYKRRLKAIAVESTFNWYWLVDGLQAKGYPMVLANPAAMKQYDGLKYADDRHDAFWLAHMLRLGILPTGYIYPRERRAVRDLLRVRLQLVRHKSRMLVAIQNQIWRRNGYKVSASTIAKSPFLIPLEDEFEQAAAQSELAVLRKLQAQVKRLEQKAAAALALEREFEILKTTTGIGQILALTIMLETGEIGRFDKVGQYASYCRCVQSVRTSNEKTKGHGNAKSGNKYLSWAFSEAAHFAVRYEPRAKGFYDRKLKQTNGIVAIRAVAHKLARAVYYMLKNQEPFDAMRAFR